MYSKESPLLRAQLSKKINKFLDIIKILDYFKLQLDHNSRLIIKIKLIYRVKEVFLIKVLFLVSNNIINSKSNRHLPSLLLIQI